MRSLEIRDCVSLSIGSEQSVFESSFEHVSWWACERHPGFRRFCWGGCQHLSEVHPLWFAIDDSSGWTGMAEAIKGHRQRRWRVPHWCLILPVTLLSGCLMFWPKRKQLGKWCGSCRQE